MSDLSPTMETALKRFQETGSLDGVRSQTVKALQRRGLLDKPSIAESIGNMRPIRYGVRMFDPYSWQPTFDIGQPDYEYWDKARWGKAEGLKLAGLFLKPLASKKAAWVLGMSPKIKLEDTYTLEKLTDWWNRNHAQVLMAYEDAINGGDNFVVVNPDLSLTAVPPSVTEELVDDRDFSKIVGWRITESYPHPQRMTEIMKIVDEYTASGRVRWYYKNGSLLRRENYRNLLGRIQVTHIPNNRVNGERYGHAEGEAVIHALQYYGTIFDDARHGNRRQGRPQAVIEKMGTTEQIDKFWDLFGKTQTQTLADGTSETTRYLEFSSDDILTLGGDAVMNFKQPGSFTSDTMNLLQIVFYMILQHTEIPEFVWGNAIASSKASAESQMAPFTKWIEKEQGRAELWLLELLTTVLVFMSLMDPQIKVEDITLKWQSLTGQDGRLTLDAIKLGLEKGILDDETALSLMPLDIDNPADVLAKVKAQLEQEADEFDRRQEALIMRTSGHNDDEQPDEEEADMQTDPFDQAIRAILEQHTGAMVAFFLDDETSRSLYDAAVTAGLSDVTPKSEMHLTLAYLGDTNELDVSRDDVTQIIADVAERFGPMRGTINGLGRFNPNPFNDHQYVVYATLDSPDLPAFRQALVEALDVAGVPVAKDHGFIPHITLAYVDTAQKTDVQIPTLDVMFSEIVLAWGEDRQPYELRGAVAAAA